jgi:translation initiation factor 3 subunit B
VRRKLRDWSKIFDEQDFQKRNQANKAVIDHRRRLLNEWRAWREKVMEELNEEADETGEVTPEGDGEVIEEIVEEIIEESEEVVM